MSTERWVDIIREAAFLLLCLHKCQRLPRLVIPTERSSLPQKSRKEQKLVNLIKLCRYHQKGRVGLFSPLSCFKCQPFPGNRSVICSPNKNLIYLWNFVKLNLQWEIHNYHILVHSPTGFCSLQTFTNILTSTNIYKYTIHSLPQNWVSVQIFISQQARIKTAAMAQNSPKSVVDERQKSQIEKRKRNLKTMSPILRGEREI